MKTTCAIVALLTAAGVSQAAVYEWEWQAGDPGDYSVNNNGGTYESVSASFNSINNQLSWSVSFSNAVTEGFTLALNNGANPKGTSGELALLYVDASVTDDVAITAYGYNGKNKQDSYKDGDGNLSGMQTPDLIKGINDTSWIIDANVIDADGGRTINFTVDATDIVGHSPLHPGDDVDWYGIGFAEKLGLWMHQFRNFDVTYDAMTGGITDFAKGGEGWFDGKDFDTLTVIVPTPGSAALLAGGAVFGVVRRRRA